jgi:predicted TPR repeat methyltransferase
MTKTFLDKVYDARTPEDARTLYDAWAATYDNEVNTNGYVTPARCAKALAQHVSDLAEPILDFGCGTGLSGTALAQAGFTTVDGVDLSSDMLLRAAEKEVYRTLHQIEPAVMPTQSYAAIAAIGVIGAGAAPLSTFDMLMNALPRSGKLVLSYNDHALEDPAYEARIQDWVESGKAALLFKEHGDHLPGIGIGSSVYVIEKF